MIRLTVKGLSSELNLTPLSLPEPDREINGVYIGDLLSWVMGRAEEGNAWITIMSNINVVAVASLSDVACVILAEGVALDEDAKKTAMEKGINILVSQKSAYHTAMEIGKLL